MKFKTKDLIATAVSIGFGHCQHGRKTAPRRNGGAEECNWDRPTLISGTPRTARGGQTDQKGKCHAAGESWIGPDTPAFPPRSLNLQIVQPTTVGKKLSSFGYEGNYKNDLLQTWNRKSGRSWRAGHPRGKRDVRILSGEKEISANQRRPKLGTNAVRALVGAL